MNSTTKPTPGFDSLKLHNGAIYSGAPVGYVERWDYRDALWTDHKVGPQEWRVNFTATKHRPTPAPIDSGAGIGTQYHWFILAHQFVRKLDADTYDTRLVGAKWRVAHRRPQWLQWSSDYPGQARAMDRVSQLCYQASHEPGILTAWGQHR
ncbi:MAG: hypothetical protein ACYDBQ_11210 [Thermoplasmatota archaeon]